jgi:Skp family chaperone for outer membrane proteins
MKIVRLSAAVAVLTVAAFCVSAQQKPATSAAPPAAAPPQNVAVPDSKMAMIYSDAFLDPKTGIARFNSLLGTLNREFQPRQAELQALQTKINTLTKEIDDTQNVADPNARENQVIDVFPFFFNEKKRVIRFSVGRTF